MNSGNFYLLAAGLPLLQGIGADVLLDWETEHILRRVAVESDEGIIIGQGEPCRTLMFLAKGRLQRITENEHWKLTETLEAPTVIEEEALWSLSRRHQHSYKATEEATMLVASKEHVMRTLMRNEIFRMNMLMRLSTKLEKANNTLTNTESEISPEEKIMAFVHRISTTPSYPKSLKIKMTTLAGVLEERRLTISNALHRLENQNMVELKREMIIFKNGR